jgi:holo-[acyl-carrier protein] synthase
MKRRASAALYGVGVDILHVSRMQKVSGRHGQRLLERILSDAEQQECATRGKDVARYLAKAFAVKEAFVKALGTGFVGVTHRDVGALRDADGKPGLAFSAALKKKLKARGVGAAHVSISDDGDLVCAMVVLERAGQ